MVWSFSHFLSPHYYSDLPPNLFLVHCSVTMLFPLIHLPFYFSLLFWFCFFSIPRTVESDRQTDGSKTVKVMDKSNRGSKMVIVRGKEFRRAAEDLSGKKWFARGVFTFRCDVTLDQREQVGGRRKNDVKCLVFPHRCSAALGMPQSLSLLLLLLFPCLLTISCNPFSDHVISSSVLLMKGKRRKTWKEH